MKWRKSAIVVRPEIATMAQFAKSAHTFAPIIPGALYFNLCIDAFGNGDEDVGQPHESVPCVTAPIDDSLIVLINNVAELIIPRLSENPRESACQPTRGRL